MVYEYNTNNKLHDLQVNSKFSISLAWSLMHLHQLHLISCICFTKSMHKGHLWVKRKGRVSEEGEEGRVDVVLEEEKWKDKIKAKKEGWGRSWTRLQHLSTNFTDKFYRKGISPVKFTNENFTDRFFTVGSSSVILIYRQILNVRSRKNNYYFKMVIRHEE